MDDIEDKEEMIREKDALLTLEKGRNLALKKDLALINEEIDKLTKELSKVKDSHAMMSKEWSLANDSVAILKSKKHALQESLSCLEVKYKDLEVQFNTLWESTSSSSKDPSNSIPSTSMSCHKCSNVDIDACVANVSKLEEVIETKNKQIQRLNFIVTNGSDEISRARPKQEFKTGRQNRIIEDQRLV